MNVVWVSFQVCWNPRRKRAHGRRGARGFHPEKVLRYANTSYPTSYPSQSGDAG